MRTEVTKRERSPYAIRSLSPLIIGGDDGVWPIAGAAAPKVKPPANAAPLLRNSLRAGRFEPMGLSFSAEPTRDGFATGRKYTLVSRPKRAQEIDINVGHLHHRSMLICDGRYLIYAGRTA